MGVPAIVSRAGGKTPNYQLLNAQNFSIAVLGVGRWELVSGSWSLEVSLWELGISWELGVVELELDWEREKEGQRRSTAHQVGPRARDEPGSRGVRCGETPPAR